MQTENIRFFENISNQDVPEVGGKNASLGEMYTRLSGKGIKIPYGFATTAGAYWNFIEQNGIKHRLAETLSCLDTKDFSNLQVIGKKCRNIILEGVMSLGLCEEIKRAYELLIKKSGQASVAVRSSATAEDLPDASFAGQQESYLNVSGSDHLLKSVHRCYASLFTDRAIQYREVHGFEHMKVALSVCVQQMVRSDQASAGVGFTLDPETGFRGVHYITGSWGLGENVVQGAVNTDEFYLSKVALNKNKQNLIFSKLGSKDITMVYAEENSNVFTKNIDTPLEKQQQFILTPEELKQLGQWFTILEEHYERPMDIEWAKDGTTGEIYIVQARPETVHAKKEKQLKRKEYTIKSRPPVVCTGVSVGDRIASGTARVLFSPSESDKLKPGEILVTDITNPDWDPILKKASAIITEKGGRTSHAAIVAREAGAIAVVGTGDATQKIKDGDFVTVSCAEGNTGFVYKGKAEWSVQEYDFTNIEIPATAPMFILGDPEKAFEYAQWPSAGVGLMRLEFIINNSIRVHPMALLNYPHLKKTEDVEMIEKVTRGYSDKKKYFTEKLSQSVAIIAAAFYPKPVIVRMSDFKSNEYANLVGGAEFEPKEENPMIGFRGASRYYHPAYEAGFRLECEAMKIVRDDMGFSNVKLMIPFCRTLEEGKKVLHIMEECGLKQGLNSLEVYVMAEIPSNIILARDFARLFNGFSIGSNDLTQLTLGIDRDSQLVSPLFDENNDAIRNSISYLIKVAHQEGVKVGICGQGPGDSIEFARFLIREEIDSLSFNPDVFLKGLYNIQTVSKEPVKE